MLPPFSYKCLCNGGGSDRPFCYEGYMFWYTDYIVPGLPAASGWVISDNIQSDIQFYIKINKANELVIEEYIGDNKPQKYAFQFLKTKEFDNPSYEIKFYNVDTVMSYEYIYYKAGDAPLCKIMSTVIGRIGQKAFKTMMELKCNGKDITPPKKT